MSNNAGDEAVWLSGLCAAFAFLASHNDPGVGTYMLLLLMVGWFVWTVVKIGLDRM
jgi:hypothetical protein